MCPCWSPPPSSYQLAPAPSLQSLIPFASSPLPPGYSTHNYERNPLSHSAPRAAAELQAALAQELEGANIAPHMLGTCRACREC
mgnify:CR=1 FL=1